jgi:hypothetical protein
MAEGTPRDEAEGAHDDPNAGDSESLEETRERHEELHREHRSRIDRLMTHCGIKEEGEGEPKDDVRRRRRHD